MLHPRLFEHFGPVGRIAILLAASLASLTSPASAQVPFTPLPDGAPALAEPAADPVSEWERFVYDRTARMTVPVSINGTAAVPFIIDTGSERTVISRELPATLTLPPAQSMLLATVSGPVVTGSYALDVPGHGKRPAILLGMDALSLSDRVEVDFRRRKVKLVVPGRHFAQIHQPSTHWLGDERI